MVVLVVSIGLVVVVWAAALELLVGGGGDG